MSFQALGPSVVRLLHVCAFLSNEDIPDVLFPRGSGSLDWLKNGEPKEGPPSVTVSGYTRWFICGPVSTSAWWNRKPRQKKRFWTARRRRSGKITPPLSTPLTALEPHLSGEGTTGRRRSTISELSTDGRKSSANTTPTHASPVMVLLAFSNAKGSTKRRSNCINRFLIKYRDKSFRTGPFYTKNARFHTTKNHSLLDGKKLCLSQTS